MRGRHLLFAAAVGLLLAGCGYNGSHASQVRQWAYANSYVANAKQVALDAYDFERAVRIGAALKMRTVCGGLSSDTGTLYSTLDAPDHTLTDEIARAMEDFFHAAETCAVASSTRQPSVGRALAEVKAGAAGLVVVDHKMAGYGIHSAELDHLVQLAWQGA